MNHLQFINQTYLASAVVRGSAAPRDRCHSRAKDSLLLTALGEFVAWERMGKWWENPGKTWENPWIQHVMKNANMNSKLLIWYYELIWNGYVSCMGLQLTISGHKNGNVNTENKCYIIDGYWIILGHGCVADNSGDVNESGYHLDIENPRLEDTSGIPERDFIDKSRGRCVCDQEAQTAKKKLVSLLDLWIVLGDLST